MLWKVFFGNGYCETVLLDFLLCGGSFHFPSKDTDSIVDAIQFFYERPDERERMGRNARKRLESNFRVSKMIECLDGFYLHLLEDKEKTFA